MTGKEALPHDIPVSELSYTDASRELDQIVSFFEQREVDVDQLVAQLERATAIVDELDRRIRRTRAQVEQLVPRLEAVSEGASPDTVPDPNDDGRGRTPAARNGLDEELEGEAGSTSDDEPPLF